MSSRIDNVLSALHFWAARPVGFLLIWITMTVAAAICMVWANALASSPKVGRTTEISTTLTVTRQLGTRKAVAAVILLVIFLVFYIATTLLWEDFTWSDNSFFTIGTLVGHNIQPPIWLGEGRFFPLAFQEFNLLRHFTDTIIGYHLLPIIQLVIFIYVLLTLDDELAVGARVALAIVVLLTPGVWISFTELMLPERDVLFFLTCLVLAVKRFEQKRSIAWAIAAIISAQLMIYYKETAFLLLFGFAAGRLLLRVWNADDAGWNYDRLWDKEGRLDLCLVALSVLFLLFYLAVMGFGNTHYADIRRQPRGEILLAYLRVDLLTWFFLAFVLGRIYLILRRHAAPILLWDGLAFGAVSCFLGYSVLQAHTERSSSWTDQSCGQAA
jgi:hypothetical protein